MAALRKIVLGLILVLSLFSSQPSSAQGLKYRGTVGIPFKGMQYQHGLTAGNGFIAEIAHDYLGELRLYVSKVLQNVPSSDQRLVLTQSISLSMINDLSSNDYYLSSSNDGKYMIIGSYRGAQKSEIYVVNVQAGTFKRWDVQTAFGIYGISNAVGDTFCIFTRPNLLIAYNLSGDLIRTSNLQPDHVPSDNNFAFDGKSVVCLSRSNSKNVVTEYSLNGTVLTANVVDFYGFPNSAVDDSGQLFIQTSNKLLAWVKGGKILEYSVGSSGNSATIQLGRFFVSSGGFVRTLENQRIQGEYCNRSPQLFFSTDSITSPNVTARLGGGLISMSGDNVQYWDDCGVWQGSQQVKSVSLRASNVRETSTGELLFYQSDSPYSPSTWSFAKVDTSFVFSVLEQASGMKYGRFNVSTLNDFLYTTNSGQSGVVHIENPYGTKKYSRPLSHWVTSVIKCSNHTVKACGPSLDFKSIVVSILSEDLSTLLTSFSLPATAQSYPDVAEYKNGDILVSERSWLYRLSASGQLLETVNTGNGDAFDKYYDDYVSTTPDGIALVTQYYSSVIPLSGLTKIYFADPNPPKTSSSVQSGWYRSNQTVQLSSVDPRPSSGFKALHSVLDTDAEVVDANPNRTINISGDGQHKLIYWAEDLDGNIETKNELTVGIDSVPPVVDSVVEGNKFILLANDDRSGIASVRYSVDGASDLEYSGEVSLPYGSYEVVFWATDKAGNKSTVGKILVGSTFRWKSVYSSPVYAGKTLKATLELSAPAGSNGVTLDISASDPSLGSLKSATILPGKTATTIEIPVLGVESDRIVDLSASLGGKTARTSVTVLVPYPSFLSINPRDVMGGNNVTITIKLPSVAPIGGQKIILSSSDPRVVVPESITVPSGQTTITMPIATQVSSTSYSATLNARAGGKGSDAVVNVLSLPSATFTISPATLNPGEKAVGAITLSAPAPASGVVFKLSSSSQDITLPSTVTILPGSVRVLFDITAKSPITPVTATVTATVDKTKLTSKVSINPSAFKAVKLSSSSFSGEGTVVGTVELTGVAPSSGSLISLASNNANVSLPATVFVPAGSLIANFTLDAKEVKTPGIATITARSGVVVKFASLTLAPITVKTLEAVPSVVTGGSASVLRIELSGKPGPGGITITLSSSNSSVASIPASVTVAQGTTILEVPIATSTVQTATIVVLSARVGTITKQTTITVNP